MSTSKSSVTPRKSKAVAEAKVSPKKSKKVAPANGVPRLMVLYRQELIPQLMEEFDYTNKMEVPRLVKIVLNIGLGEAIQNQRVLESAQRNLSLIAGQHPVITKARKSIANYKLRAGQNIGVMVTLRGHRMYEFFDRLVNAALPRLRDFRGLSLNSFDTGANYSLGIGEQTLFPEIEYNTEGGLRGLEATFVTTARRKEESQRLLQLLGMPFSR